MSDLEKSNIFADYPDTVNISQVMKMLNIGKYSVFKLIKTKKLKAVKIGNKYRIKKENIIKVLDEEN